MDTPLHIVSITSFAALLAACASSPYPAAPTVPPSLQAPAGSTLYLEALASGVQIYECSRKPDATYEWTFKAPEATLTARSGQPLGKHYAGPTWEALDGSTTVGVVGHARSESVSLWARRRIPTGWGVVWDRPVRYVFEFAATR